MLIIYSYLVIELMSMSFALINWTADIYHLLSKFALYTSLHHYFCPRSVSCWTVLSFYVTLCYIFLHWSRFFFYYFIFIFFIIIFLFFFPSKAEFSSNYIKLGSESQMVELLKSLLYYGQLLSAHIIVLHRMTTILQFEKKI